MRSRPPSKAQTPYASLQKLCGAVAACGSDPEEFLASLGIPPATGNDFERTLDYGLYLKAFHRAEEICGLPSLGRTLGEKAVLSAFDLYGQVILYAETLAEALTRAVRFYCIWSTAGELTFSLEGDSAVLGYQVPGVDPDWARPDVEFSLTAALAALRSAASQPIQVLSLAWPHPSRDPEGDVRFFGASPGHTPNGARAALPASALQAPLVQPPGLLKRAVEDYAEKVLHQAQGCQPCQEALWAVFPALERQARWDIASAADSLHQSPRSLQRGLQGEGTTFGQELARYRRARSRELLEKTEASLYDLAFALGYSEASAFLRAFKKWEGMTPGEYRQAKRTR